MLVLGLLLILAAALVTFGAIVDATETATVEIFGQTVTTTAAGVFVVGLATMLVFLLGVWLVYGSLGRSRRRRAERKEAKKKHNESVRRLEEEQAELRRENERLARELQSSTTTTAPVAGGAGLTAPSAGQDLHDTEPAHEDTAHEGRSGARGLMDKVTGRDSHHAHDTPETDPLGPDRTARDDHVGHDHVGHETAADSRVVDHRTDVTEPQHTGGRHREEI